MIDFLSPLWLAAAAGAAVPLLIHLLRRRTGARVEFPAVRYLARAEREHSRRLKLRNLLLMLLRVAAVVLIAAAAARPVVRLAGTGHAPTALAVVLDNSLSTSAIAGGRPVLDELRAAAERTVAAAAAADRVWLVTADGAVYGGTRAAVARAIAQAAPLAGAGDLEGAVVRAASLAAGAGLTERDVAVFTDAQASTWSRPISLSGARVQLYRPGHPPPRNRAVVAAAAVPSLWTPRGTVRARVLTPDSATFRITLDGRTLARGTARRDEEVMVRATPAERGWHAGTVEIEPDELRGDDVRWFAVWIGPAPAVRVDSSAGPFTASAVAALVQAERAAPGARIALLSADRATALPALLLAPADPVRAGAANRALERLGVPWRLGPLRRGQGDVEGSAALAGVSVTQRYVLEPQGAGDTLATVAGEPWIVAGPRYVLIGSPLTPDATTLPVRAAFVPWLADVLSQRLDAAAGVVRDVTPLARLARPAGAEALEVGGSTEPLAGDSLTAPDRPGVYFLMRGGERTGALVVNPDSAESDLRRLSDAELAARVHAATVSVTDDPERMEAAVFASSPRRPLVLPLLIAAVLALAAESAITRQGRAPV